MSYRWFIGLVILLALFGAISADPLTGNVTSLNSVTGSNAGDQIGSTGVIELSSGNIVIVSPNWNSGRGAVTCLTPAEYQTGNFVISNSNSLVGTLTTDAVGTGGIIVLSNGNYVVRSQNWDNNTTLNVGAVTWVDGTTCIPYGETSRGAFVGTANSLVGTTADDQIGSQSVTALSNGNYVVSSPNWNDGGTADIGAVTWVAGSTGIPANELSGAVAVSTNNSLTGERANNSVGSSGIVELSNGNYVVRSPNWDSSSLTNTGAATLVDVTGTKTGTVTVDNSLTGATNNDNISSTGVLALPVNGNYVVQSTSFDRSGQSNVGAATWVNGTSGVPANELIAGVQVSINNSIVGTRANDNVAASGVTLPSGNYVIISSSCDNGTTDQAGAVTWGDGTTGITGAVSSSNSLVGSNTNVQDLVGAGGVTVLTNGNYVVNSPFWDNNNTSGGAVTWASGTGGITGAVSSGNSFVGGTSLDLVGNGGIVALNNGNYVIISTQWDNGGTTDAGAVTWVNGSNGRGFNNAIGTVSSGNSLVGTTASDAVGSSGVTALTNGNYVVRSPNWGAANVGAATWGNGTNGTTGNVSSTNSLIGSTSNDNIGNSNVVALTNGNYVVVSTNWDNGAANVGAVTLGNGTNGTPVGTVSTGNSLYGSTADDNVGSGGITTLVNGHYAVRSPNWDNGAANVGAVTRGDGTTGVTGAVSATNSWIGSTANDQVGSGGVTAFANGFYVIVSQNWDNGVLAADVGAVTLGVGSGVVSASNSLIGSTGSDQIGSGGIVALSSNGYLIRSPNWDGGAANVGAVTYNISTLGEVNLTTLAPLTEGATGSYDVSLSIAPNADVLITLSFSDDITVEGEPDGSVILTFTPDNWNTPQTVDVTAVNDRLVESDHTATITHVVASSDLAYDEINPTPGSEVNVSITDNDSATITFESSGANVPEDTAGTHSINTVLTTTTNGDGVEALDLSADLNVGLVITENDGIDGQDYSSPTSISYDKNATNGTVVPINVTVTSDQIDDNNESLTFALQNSTTVGITFSGSYLLAIDDNDITGVSIVQSDDTTVITEGVQDDNYTIGLTSKPRGDVTITLAATTLNVSPTTITFTTANWNTPRLVNVSTTNDLLNEQPYTENITHAIASIDDALYNAYTVSDVVVTVNDNDIPGVTLSKTSIAMDESSADQQSYTVVLNVEPLDNVVITLATSDDLLLTESGAPVDLTFTPLDWNQPQTVEITMVDDALYEGSVDSVKIMHTVSSTTDYNGIVVNDVTVSITDNETATVAFASGIGTANEGTSPYTINAILTVSATGTGPVALGLAQDLSLNVYEFTGVGNTDFNLATASITFAKDAATGTTQPVEINIVDDQLEETDAELFGLALQLSTGSLTSYSSTHVVTITDNDAKGLTLVESDNATSVVEGGVTDTYTVALSSEPTAPVEVTLSATQVTLNPSTLNFDSTNWDDPVTITVTAVDDSSDEELHSDVVVHSATSSDPNYNYSAIASLTVTINDPEFDDNLLANPGFEDHTESATQPDNWTRTRLSTDRLRCGTIAYQGSCAYNFVGSSTENSLLSQTTSAVTNLTSGVTLNASLYYKTNTVTPKLNVKLLIYYNESTTPVSIGGTIKTVSSGSYTQFSLPSYTIPEGWTVKKVKFTLQNRAKSGKIWLDEASLNYTYTVPRDFPELPEN